MERRPAKKQPSREELKRQRRLEQKQLAFRQQTLQRRRDMLLKVTVGAIATATGAGVFWQIRSRNPDSQLQTQPVSELERKRKEYVDDEQTMEVVLGRADQIMSDLGRLIVEKGQTQQAEDFGQLLTPIKIWDVNKENPKRNKYTILRQDLDQRGDVALREGTQLVLKDIRHFHTDLLKDEGPFASTFSPVSRTMSLSEQLSSSNLLDGLITYHELEHARQDSVIRANLTTLLAKQQYDQFYTSQPGQRRRTIITFEHEAYLKELMAMNLLTDGQLKEDGLSGRINIDEYQTRLGARVQQRPILEFLGGLATAAFKSGTTLREYSPIFTQQINQFYFNQGYDLYGFQSGMLVRVG